MALPSLRLIAAGTALLLAFAAGWVAQGWRMQTALGHATNAHNQQLQAMHAQALATYQKQEDQKNAAIQAAQALAEQNQAAATTARATVERLRRDLARVPARIQSATEAAVNEYAAAATAVLDDCTAEVTKLARAADGHATDAQLTHNAWPRK